MVYESLVDFRADAMTCGEAHYPDGSLHHEKLASAYSIYRNAVGGTRLPDLEGNPTDFGLTIVGRLALRARDGTWISSNEDFPSIDEILKENLKTIGEGGDSHGSILDAKNWSLLANDAWLLGGIHALTEFHFASPLRWQNLWDEAADRMTVTAREVIGIVTFGYAVVRPNPRLEAVAVCRDETRAATASLPDYQAAVRAHESIGALRQFHASLTGASHAWPC
jgi:hypothetical protein